MARCFAPCSTNSRKSHENVYVVALRRGTLGRQKDGMGHRAVVDTLHIRGFWTIDRIAIAHVGAVLPALVVALNERGALLLPPVAVALAVTFFWQVVFAWLRHSLVSWDGIVAAIVFVMLTPHDVPLTQIAIALTFGVVMGEQIFGGRGRAFLSPAAAGLVFVYLSFPASAAGAASLALGLAALLGATPLVALGLAPWRVLAGAATGLAVAAAVMGMDIQQLSATSGAFMVAVVFLGCDPICSASTNIGRLIYGLMIGVLAISLGYGGGTAENAAVAFAVFLASLFAPGVDRGVILLHSRRMRRRYA